MTNQTQAQDRESLLTTLDAYHDAMVAARTDLLDKLVAPDFFLVHITGYRQPRQEWFGVIRSREFDYHRIEPDEASFDLKVSGDTATLAGRGIFQATINGMNNPWRLTFTLQFARRDGVWIIRNARYGTF